MTEGLDELGVQWNTREQEKVELTKRGLDLEERRLDLCEKELDQRLGIDAQYQHNFELAEKNADARQERAFKRGEERDERFIELTERMHRETLDALKVIADELTRLRMGT